MTLPDNLNKGDIRAILRLVKKGVLKLELAPAPLVKGEAQDG